MAEPLPAQELDSSVDPDHVSRQKFDLERRGFDQQQVRAYLLAVSDALRDAQSRESDMRMRMGKAIRRAEQAEQVAREARPTDDSELTRQLGDEVTVVLDAARAAGEQRIAVAERSAEKLLANAKQEANDLRGAAENVMAERSAEAEARSAEIMADTQRQVDAIREKARSDHEDARQHSMKLIGRARAEGDALISEAEQARAQILDDMDRRRRQARAQVERLRVGRDRLLRSYDVVRRTLDEATNELKVSLADAKVRADGAVRRVEAEPPANREQLEAEVADAKLTGLIQIDLSQARADDTQTLAHDVVETSENAETVVPGLEVPEVPEVPEASEVPDVPNLDLRARGVASSPFGGRVEPGPKRPLEGIPGHLDSGGRETLRPPVIAPTIKAPTITAPTTTAPTITGGVEEDLSNTAELVEQDEADDVAAVVWLPTNEGTDEVEPDHLETEDLDSEDLDTEATALEDIALGDTEGAERLESDLEYDAVEVEEEELDASDRDDVADEVGEEEAQGADLEFVVDEVAEADDAQADDADADDVGGTIEEEVEDLVDGDLVLAADDDEQEAPAEYREETPDQDDETDEDFVLTDEEIAAAFAEELGESELEIIEPPDEVEAVVALAVEEAPNQSSRESATEEAPDDREGASLFALLRAQRTDDSLSGDTLVAERKETSVDQANDTVEQAGDTTGHLAHGDVVEQDDSTTEDAEFEYSDEDLVRQRDAIIADSTTQIERRLKRALADEQNELLSGARSKKNVQLVDLVGDPDEHLRRYVLAITETAVVVYGAGAALFDASLAPGELPAGAVEEILAAGIIDPVRERLVTLQEADVEVDTTALRAFYRQRKVDHLPDVAHDLAVLLCTAGVCDSLPVGTALPW